MPAYNFHAQFAPAVARREKRQTIRAHGKRPPPKIGDTLYLYTGMRTSSCRKLGTGKCTSVELIEIDPKRREVSMPRPFGSGQAWTRLEAEEVAQLAKDDGFSSVDAFFEWFAAIHVRSVSGYLVRWE